MPDPDDLSYLTQTTLSVDETSAIVADPARALPAIAGPAARRHLLRDPEPPGRRQGDRPPRRRRPRDRLGELLELQPPGRGRARARHRRVPGGRRDRGRPRVARGAPTSSDSPRRVRPRVAGRTDARLARGARRGRGRGGHPRRRRACGSRTSGSEGILEHDVSLWPPLPLPIPSAARTRQSVPCPREDSTLHQPPDEFGAFAHRRQSRCGHSGSPRPGSGVKPTPSSSMRTRRPSSRESNDHANLLTPGQCLLHVHQCLLRDAVGRRTRVDGASSTRRLSISNEHPVSSARSFMYSRESGIEALAIQGDRTQLEHQPSEPSDG